MSTQIDPRRTPDSPTVLSAPAIPRAAVLGIELAVTDYDGVMEWMDAVVRALGPDGHDDVPLRRQVGRGAGAADHAPARALPGPADRRRLVAAVSRAERGGARRGRGAHQRLRRRRGLGGHGPTEAGEVDGPDARPPRGAGARRRRRRVRLPRRDAAAGAAVDAARRARMELSPRARAAPAVAPLRALQPALRRRVRPPVRHTPRRSLPA